MPAAWPAGVPTAPLQAGFRYSREDNRIAFQPEIGPPKRRRRTFTSMYLMDCVIQMTDSEFSDFEDFYDGDLQEGVYQFTFPDPRTETTERWTFESSYSAEFANMFSGDGPVWNVSFTLRRMP